MTTSQRDPIVQTPFSKWLREKRELDSVIMRLSITDADFWVHRFSERKENKRTSVLSIVEHIQLLEIKTFMADVPFAQADTLYCIDMMLRTVLERGGRRRPVRIPDNRRPGTRSCRWLGVHVLQMSGARPDESSRVIWDKLDVNERQLCELIRFDRDPDHPQKFLDTRRHHVAPLRETLSELPFAAE